jgi:hypothetical protein
MVIACSGHNDAHVPHPLHSAFSCDAFWSITFIALYGHTSSQSPQPIQYSSSTKAMVDSIRIVPRARSEAALEAAALP